MQSDNKQTAPLFLFQYFMMRMKKVPLLLGIIYLAVLWGGLVVIGFNLPDGEPPLEYQWEQERAARKPINVDHFAIERINGAKELWLRDMPNASYEVIVTTTNDPRKCCIKYPKDLIQITLNDGVLYGNATPKGEKIDTEKQKLIHNYSDFDKRVLNQWDTPDSLKDELAPMKHNPDDYTIFIYMTVMKDFSAIRTDSPGFTFNLLDVNFTDLYFTAAYNTFLHLYGNTKIDRLWVAWVGYLLNFGRAKIKNLRIDIDEEQNFIDTHCKVDTLLLTGKGNVSFLTRKSFKVIEVQEKKPGDINYGYDSIPMINIAKPYGKK